MKPSTVPVLSSRDVIAQNALNMEVAEGEDIEAVAQASVQARPATPRENTDKTLPPEPAKGPGLKRRVTFGDVASTAAGEDDDTWQPPLRSLTSIRGERARDHIRRGFREYLHDIKVRYSLPSPRKHQRQPQTIYETQEVSLEFLHRYKILLSRSRLLRYFRDETELTDENASECIFQELSRYSCAIRDYLTFRSDGGHPFAFDSVLDQIVADTAHLDATEKKLTSLPPGSEDVEKLNEEVEERRLKLARALLGAVRSTTSGISARERKKAREALWSRLIMALSGGVALVAPMLVMILHPTKLTTILTTSCCVLAVAVALAVFMVDSHPKDVLACTAAYTAVLVVFVGVGGGT